MAIRAGKYWETVPGQWPEDPPRERLTPAGAEYLVKNQVPPPRDDARADSDGLRMVEKMDESNRPIRTFELAPGRTKRDTWMAPHMAAPEEMVMLNIKQIPGDQFKAVEAKWRADRALRDQVARDLAAGKDVRFADFESGRRTS